ncbi:MAG: hypothetical protein AB8F95_12175 [Bacteroidia bacterium]
MNKPESKYLESDIEVVFQKLILDWDELAGFYNKEVKYDYDEPSNRLPYIDIGDIARFIVKKKKAQRTEHFEVFFEHAEELLTHGDDYVQNLIVVGLFEGIQNIGGADIDYYHSFDKWLKPSSLKAWKELIDFWEKRRG